MNVLNQLLKILNLFLTDYLGDNLDKIYSQAGPSTGIESDETSVFQGENTAEIKVILTARILQFQPKL